MLKVENRLFKCYVKIVIKSAEALRTNPDIFLISKSKERASCSKPAADLLPCGCRVDIRMRSNRLLSPDDNKSAPSCRCQQACCKLRPDSTTAKFFARNCLCEIRMVGHE